jgi:hypothetical protein
MQGRGWGKLAVCLDFFDEVFWEKRTNWQFALPCSEEIMACAQSRRFYLNAPTVGLRLAYTWPIEHSEHGFSKY